VIEPLKNSIHPKTRSAWRTWLSNHHEQGEGIWLISWKKASGKRPIAYGDLVEEPLCFGWIDSKPNKLDDERWMLWFAPRNAKIEAAKKGGTWNVLNAVEALEIPPDLLSAIAKHKAAAENFENFPMSAKRGILEWISNAKTPPTRAKRVTETADLAAINERANQWPKFKSNE
jgi:uncharacterized protein YdeI (YjbR/CyaY-like superfamily)